MDEKGTVAIGSNRWTQPNTSELLRRTLFNSTWNGLLSRAFQIAQLNDDSDSIGKTIRSLPSNGW
ncbi:MAG: hypothetical protein AAGH81_15540 [Bacteroidota bacterium]